MVLCCCLQMMGSCPWRSSRPSFLMGRSTRRNLRSSFTPLTQTTPSKLRVLTPFHFTVFGSQQGVQQQCFSSAQAAGVQLALQNSVKSPFLLGLCLILTTIMISSVLVVFSGHFLAFTAFEMMLTLMWAFKYLFTFFTLSKSFAVL